MPEPWIRLAPAVPDLAALGARTPADLLGVGGALEDEDRAEVLERRAGFTRLRCPLPGTPGPDGRRRGRPRGAGTGLVWVLRWRGAPLAERLRARFTAPRSESPAARAWNLYCVLRDAGVATPDLLAVGEAPAALAARDSVLVLRAPDALPTWAELLARGIDGGERERLATELAGTLERAFRAGIWLPRLGPGDLRVREPRDETAPVAGLDLARRPGLLVTSVDGGRLVRRIPAGRRARLIARLTDVTLRG